MDPKSTGTEDERFCLVHFGTISVRSFGLYNAPLTLENQNWRSGMSGMCLVCNSVFAVAAAPKIVGSGPKNNHRHRCHSPNDFQRLQRRRFAPTAQQSWFGLFLSRGKVTWTRLVIPEVRGEFIKFREWKQQLSLKGRRLGTAGGMWTTTINKGWVCHQLCDPNDNHPQFHQVGGW